MNWFIVWILPPILAIAVAYLLWRIDEWQEQRWQKARSLKYMAAMLAASEALDERLSVMRGTFDKAILAAFGLSKEVLGEPNKY